MLLIPYTFNFLIDLYYHKINSKRRWLCYWILTLSMFPWTSFYVQLNYKLLAFAADSLHFQFLTDLYYHKINSKLAWLCYWILTLSMFSSTSFDLQLNYKLLAFVTESLHFYYDLIICITSHDHHLVLDPYTFNVFIVDFKYNKL